LQSEQDPSASATSGSLTADAWRLPQAKAASGSARKLLRSLSIDASQIFVSLRRFW
jgi:hypothetical protein